MKNLITLSFYVTLCFSEFCMGSEISRPALGDMEPEAYEYACELYWKAGRLAGKRMEEINKEFVTRGEKYNKERTQLGQKWSNGTIAQEDWEAAITALKKEYDEDENQQLLREESRSLNAMMSEFRTILVTLDEDGNPVCNIDLAKYGLSMPIITPKPDRNYQGRYTVVFPHELENAQPTNATETIVDQSQPTNALSTKVLDISNDISSEQQETPVKKSKPYWIGVLVLVVIGGVIAGKIVSCKKSK